MIRRFSIILLSLFFFSNIMFADNGHRHGYNKDEKEKRLRHVGSLYKFMVDSLHELDLTTKQKEQIDQYLKEFNHFRKARLDEYKRNFDTEDFIKKRKERRKEFYKVKENLRENIKKILTPQQQEIMKNKLKEFIKRRKRHHDTSCNDRR